MIEEFLEKQSAETIANSPAVWKSLEGETIQAVLDGIVEPGDQGWKTIFVFQSGNSLTQHSKGGYWISSKKITRELLERLIKDMDEEHKKYLALSELIERV